MAHACKVLLKLIATPFSNYCEREGISPGGTKWLPFNPLDLRHDVCGPVSPQPGVGGKYPALCVLHRSHQGIQLRRPKLLWTVPKRFGIMPSEILAIICKFHDGMSARVRMDDVPYSDWFDVGQGL